MKYKKKTTKTINCNKLYTEKMNQIRFKLNKCKYQILNIPNNN